MSARERWMRRSPRRASGADRCGRERRRRGRAPARAASLARRSRGRRRSRWARRGARPARRARRVRRVRGGRGGARRRGRRQHALMSASVFSLRRTSSAVRSSARATRSRLSVCVSSSASVAAATSTVDSATRAAAAVDALAWRLRDARRRSSAVRAGGRGPKVEGRDARVRRARRDANHEERADVVGRVCVARDGASRGASGSAETRGGAGANPVGRLVRGERKPSRVF